MASSSLRAIDMERNQEKKMKKKGVRASFKKGWRAVKGCCSCTQSNDLDPSEEPYLPVLNPVVLADTADRPGCDLEQTPLEDPVDPPQDPSGLKQTAPEEPTDNTAEQQTEGKKKKKKGVCARFKKGWQAMKHSCARNNKVVPLSAQPDLDPSDPQPAPVDPQPAPVDPQPAPVDPQPAPVGPQPAPVDPQPAPVDPQPAPVDPQPAPVDPQPAPVDPAEDRPEGKKKKKGVCARFKKGWQAIKHSCARNNKVVPLSAQPDLDPSDPQPAPVDPQPAPVDPQPAPEYPQPAPVDPQPAPVDPQPAPVDPQPAPVDPQPAPVDPQPASEDPQPKDPEAYDRCSFDFTKLIEDFYRSLSEYDPYVQRILENFPPDESFEFPALWYTEQEFLYELDKYEAFSALYEVDKYFIGKGHHGIVYRGTRKSDGLKVAIKFMYKSDDRFIHVPGYDKPLVSEVAVNLMLHKPKRCPNIVALLDWFEEDEIYILVLEYPYPCLSMIDFLDVERLSEDQARPLMRQAVNAAQHCIDHDVCHGSLDTRNTVINLQTMTLMFIDFGNANLASTWEKPDPEDPEPVFGTPEPTWVEPSGESWGRGHAVANMVSSLSKLLLCMMGGCLVTIENHVPIDKPEFTQLGLTEECLDLIKRSGLAPASERPTLEELLDHKWFKQG